jgi:hypothetical protein
VIDIKEDHCGARAKAYFEGFGENLAHVLLAQVTGGAKALLDLGLLAVSLGRTTSGARADGATEYLWPPPPVYGTFRMVEAEHRVRVSKRPSVRGLGEARDYVEGGKGKGGTGRGGFGGRRTGGVGGDDAGASRGGDGFHAATVLDTQDTTGLIWTGSVNERLRVRLFLVVGRNCDHGVLGTGRGRQGALWLVGRLLIQRDGRGRVGG